jgi:hypothetical protein
MFGLEVTVKFFAQLKQRVTIHLLSISGQVECIPVFCRDNKLFVGHGWVRQYCKNTTTSSALQLAAKSGYLQYYSVQFADPDPDPGSGAFLTTGSGIGKIWIRDKHPGSATLIMSTRTGTGIIY